MRSRISVGLVLVCLGLAGCGLTNKNGGQNSGNSKLFTGLPANQDPASGTASPPPSSVSADADLPPRVDGVLAGQVVNKGSNRRLPMAHIQVVDLQNPRGPDAAQIVETDKDGFFIIRGLQKGRDYQLIARAWGDGRILAGAELVRPPNPKVNILVVEDTSTPNNDSPQSQPPSSGQGSPDRGTRPNGPAAFIDPPIGSRPEPSPVPSTAQPVQPPVNPAQVAEGGFQNAPPRSPVANMTGPTTPPAPDILPPPPGYNMTPNVPPISTNPGIPVREVSNPLPDESSPPPPWCQLQGRQLKNLAVFDLDLQPWEFARHRKGKVVLLDFWSTQCKPCLQSIHHLNDLQAQFRPYGLEVIGIAYEPSGGISERAQKVKSTRGRFLMNYTTLLGGDPGRCPVKTQFMVTLLPTLVLLDKEGFVVWRSGQEGLTSEKLRELQYEIARQLGVRVPSRWE